MEYNPVQSIYGSKKYNCKDLISTRVIVQTNDELPHIKALQKELKQLKDLLVKNDLEKLVTDNYLGHAAAEKLGYKDVQ